MIRRGSIYMVDFDPVVGSEANKTRPAVVVSSDAANTAAFRRSRGVVTVVAITSNVDRVYPFHVFLTSSDTGLDRDSKAQAEQVRAVDVLRVGEQVGIVRGTEMLEIEEAIRLHLAL